MEVQRKLASLDVILWLRENYKVGKNGSVSKNSVFQHYYDACQDKGIEPVISATYFGKLVKRAFPGIKYNRKGPRGSAVQHYTCLKRMKQPGEHGTASVPSPYAPHDYGTAGAASTLLGGQYAAEDMAMCHYSLKREKLDYDEASPSLVHSPTPTASFSPRRRRSMFPHVFGASAHAHAPHHPYHHTSTGAPYPVPHYHHHHPDLLHPPYRPPPLPPHARVPSWSPTTADDGPPPVSDAGAPCSSPDDPPSNPWHDGATTGPYVPSYHPHQGQYHRHHHHPPHSAPYDLEDTSPYSHTNPQHPRHDLYHHPSSSSSFAPPHHRSPSPTATYSPRHRAFSHSILHHPGPPRSHPANSPSMPPPFSPGYPHPAMAPGSHSQAHPHSYAHAHAHAGSSRPSGSSSPTSPSGSSHIGSSNPPSPPSPPPHLLLPSLDSAAFASPLLPSHSSHASSATNRAAPDSNHQHLHHGHTGDRQHPRPQQSPTSSVTASYSPALQPAVGTILPPAPSTVTSEFEAPTHLEVYSSPAFAGSEQQPLRPPLGRSSSPAFEHLLRGITSRDVEDEELVSFCDRYLKQAHTP